MRWSGGGQRFIVARHQAAVGRTFEEGHIEGGALGLFQLAAGIEIALFLAFQKGVAAGDFGITRVEVGGAADDLQRVLGGDEGGQRENEEKERPS